MLNSDARCIDPLLAIISMMFIFTIYYSKNFTTKYLLTMEHIAMFVVKSIHIQINGQFMDLSITTSAFF